jgi:hypothetical protein
MAPVKAPTSEINVPNLELILATASINGGTN